ncbi:MAG: hypothetical protein JJ896_16065 [Rhodothermales bacterium]|nr:hypothetical protein [Rhodothermales bacterium]MBO6781171.1 hypothetical protein [Rhodothermales bacterium]
MSEHDVCLRCAGRMELGFTLDINQGSRRVMGWHPGHPRKSFFTGVKNPGEEIPIGVLRCVNCGYLEFYARPEFRALSSDELELTEARASGRELPVTFREAFLTGGEASAFHPTAEDEGADTDQFDATETGSADPEQLDATESEPQERPRHERFNALPKPRPEDKKTRGW